MRSSTYQTSDAIAAQMMSAESTNREGVIHDLHRGRATEKAREREGREENVTRRAGKRYYEHTNATTYLLIP